MSLQPSSKVDLDNELKHVEESTDAAEGTLAIDPKAEKKLLLKCDLHLLPPLTVIFFLSFMDRTNIGNARIQGMTEDLNMEGTDYNMALFIFFVPYILFELPSNLIIKRIPPSLWLSGITVFWGIATVGMGLVNNNAGLIGCRVVLGFFEAGILPGCVYLISMYYKRFEVQWRMSLLFCASILAGAFSGLLAYAIGNMSGVGGYESWRWIFILEGLLTVVIGVLAKWWIPDWPETAKFLNDDERAMLLSRLSQDIGEAKMDHLNKRAAKRIVKDWKIYFGTVAYLGATTTGYAGSFFIPTILNQMGFVASEAQVRTIPVYIVSTVTCLIAAYLTDRLRHRYTFTMVGILIATVGYVLLLCQQQISTGVRYFALFVIVSGGYITQPIALGWLSNTVSGHYKRSVSSATQIGLGNMGGIIASLVFFDREAPLYRTGLGVSLGMLWLCAAGCSGLYLYAVWENKKRDRGERDGRLLEPDADNLGDDHPHWRYVT